MAINELNRLSKSSKGVLATSDTTTNESFNRSQVNSQKNGASFVTSFEGSWAGDYKLALGKDAVNPGSSSFGLEGFGDIDFIPYSDRTNAVSYKGQAQVGSPIAFEVVGPTLKSSSFKDITWNVASVSPSANGLLTLHLNTSTVDNVYGLTGPAYDETELWALVIKGDTATRRENAVVLKVNTIINSTNMSVLEPTQSLYTAGDVVQVVFLRQAKSQMVRVPNTSSYLIMPPDRSLNSGLYPTASEWVSLGGDANFYGVGTAIAIPQPMNLVSGSVLTASLGNVLPTDLGTFDITYDDTTTGIFADTSYYLNKVVRITKVKDASNDAVIEQGEDAVIGYFQIKEIDAEVSSAVVLTLLGQPTINHKTGVITYAGPYLSAGSANVEFTLHDTVDTLSSNYRADLVESARVKRLLSPSISSSGSIGGEVIPTSASSSLNECVFTETSTYSHNLLDLGFKAVVYGGSSALGASVIDPQYYTVDYEGAIVYLNADAPIYDNYYISCVPVTEDAGQQGYGTRVTYNGKDVFCGNIDITSVKTGNGLTTVLFATAGANTSLNFPNILASEVPETGVIEINTGATRYKLKYNSKSALGDDSVVIGDLTYLQDPVDFGTALSNGHVCFVRNLYSTREDTLQAGASVRVNEMSMGSLSTEVLKLIDGSVQVPSSGFYAQELVGAFPVGSTADIGRVHWDADTQTWQVTSAPRGGAPDAYEVNLELTRGSITASKILELTGDDVEVHTTLFKATSVNVTPVTDNTPNTTVQFGIDTNDFNSPETFIGDITGMKVEVAGSSYKTILDLNQYVGGEQLVYSFNTTKGEQWQPQWQEYTPELNYGVATISQVKDDLSNALGAEHVSWANEGETEILLTGEDVSIFPTNPYIESITLAEFVQSTAADELIGKNVTGFIEQASQCIVLGYYPENSHLRQMKFRLWYYVNGFKYLVRPTSVITSRVSYDEENCWVQLIDDDAGVETPLVVYKLQLGSTFYIETLGIVSPSPTDEFTLFMTNDVNPSPPSSPLVLFPSESSNYDGGVNLQYLHRIDNPTNWVYSTNVAEMEAGALFRGPMAEGNALSNASLSTRFTAHQYAVTATLQTIFQLDSADETKPNRWVVLYNYLSEANLLLDTKSADQSSVNYTCVSFWKQMANIMNFLLLSDDTLAKSASAGFFPSSVSPSGWIYGYGTDGRLRGRLGLVSSTTYTSLPNYCDTVLDTDLELPIMWVAADDARHPNYAQYDSETGCVTAFQYNPLALVMTGHCSSQPSKLDQADFIKILAKIAEGSVEANPTNSSSALIDMGGLFNTRALGLFNNSLASNLNKSLGLSYTQTLGPLLSSHRTLQVSGNNIKAEFDYKYGDYNPSRPIRSTLKSKSNLFDLSPSVFGTNNNYHTNYESHPLDSGLTNTVTQSEATYGISNWGLDNMGLLNNSHPNFHAVWLKLSTEKSNETFGLTLKGAFSAPEIIDSSIQAGDVVFFSYLNGEELLHGSGRVIDKTETAVRVIARSLDSSKDQATGFVPPSIGNLVKNGTNFGFTTTDLISIVSGGTTTLTAQGAIKSLATPNALADSVFASNWEGGVGVFGTNPAAVLVSGGRIGLLSGFDQPSGLNFAKPITGTYTEGRAFETFVEQGIFTTSSYPNETAGKSAGLLGALNKESHILKSTEAPATGGIAGLRISGDTQIWVSNPRYLSSRGTKTAHVEGYYVLGGGFEKDIYPKASFSVNNESNHGGAHRPDFFGSVDWGNGRFYSSVIVNLGLTMADIKGITAALSMEGFSPNLNFDAPSATDFLPYAGVTLFNITQNVKLSPLSLPFLRDTYLTLASEEGSTNDGIWKVKDTPVLVPMDAHKFEQPAYGSYSSVHHYGAEGLDRVRLGLNTIVATLRVRVERFITNSSNFTLNQSLVDADSACSWSFSQYNAVTNTYNPIVMMDVVSIGADTEQDLFGLEINPRALGKKSLPASIVPITSTFPTPISQWENKDAVRLLGVHRLMNQKGATPSVAFLSIQDPTGSLFNNASFQDQARIVIYSAERADRMDELAGVSTQGKFADDNSGQIDGLGHPKRLGLGVVIDGGLGVIATNAVRTHNVKGPQDKLGSLAVFGAPFMNPYDEELDADPVTISSRLNRTEFYGDIIMAGFNSDLVIEDSRASYGFYSRSFESKISSASMVNHTNKVVSYSDNSTSYASLPILQYIKDEVFPQINHNDTLSPWTKAGIKIKGAGSVVYERGFNPKDATGSNLLSSLTKGAKSDLGLKGLEIPAFGECLLLPKGPETLFSYKVPYSSDELTTVLKVGLTATDHPLYEFYNGTNAFAFGGLFSINLGNVIEEEGGSIITQQQVPNLVKNQIRNAPEVYPGLLAQAYHHVNANNSFQVRLLEGMVIEDVTTGTFYSVGDIGRFRGFGSDTYMKPLGASGDVSIWKNQRYTGSSIAGSNIIDTDFQHLWESYFDYPAMRPYSVGGCIGAQGHGFDAELFYDLSPHFNPNKALTTTTDESLTTGGETGFGDRVDNGNVRRPSVGHKMRIVPNVEFVPVLGHRSVTGGLAVPYDKDNDYATYIQDADAILYDINYSFTKQDIGKTLYLCGSREYALVGWYIISDVISDYVIDPDLSLFSAGLDVAVVRKVKRTGEPLSLLPPLTVEKDYFSQNSIQPLLPLRPQAPTIHASLDYNTNGTLLGGEIVDTHTHDPFFPKYLSTTDTGMLTSSGIARIRPYIDPASFHPVQNPDKMFSDLTYSIELTDGRVFRYYINKDLLVFAIQTSMGGYGAYGYDAFNTKELCDYLNGNIESNGLVIGSYLKAQGQAGWADYDDFTPLIVWEYKSFRSSYINAGNNNAPYLPRKDADGTETYNYNPKIDPSNTAQGKICGLTASINKRALDLLGVDTNLLCGRSSSFSVSFVFNPQLELADPLTTPWSEQVVDFSVAYHPEARGFYSFKGHSSEFDMGSFDANSYIEHRLFNIYNGFSTAGTPLPSGDDGEIRVYTQAEANLDLRRANAVCSAARGLRWVFSAPLLEENVGSYAHLTKPRPYRFGIATLSQWNELNDNLAGGETTVKVNPYSWTSGWQRNDGYFTAQYDTLDLNTDIFRVNRCPSTGSILLGGDCETYGVENNYVMKRTYLNQSMVKGGEIAYSPLTVMGNWQDTDTGLLPSTGSWHFPIMYALQPVAREKIVTISPSSMMSNQFLTTASSSSVYETDVSSKAWVFLDKSMMGGLFSTSSANFVTFNSYVKPHAYTNTEGATTYTKTFYSQDYSWAPASEWWQITSSGVTTSNLNPATLRIDLTEAFTQSMSNGSGLNSPYLGRTPKGARLNRIWVNFGLNGDNVARPVPGAPFGKDILFKDDIADTYAPDLDADILSHTDAELYRSSSNPITDHVNSITFNLVVEIPGSIGADTPTFDPHFGWQFPAEAYTAPVVPFTSFQKPTPISNGSVFGGRAPLAISNMPASFDYQTTESGTTYDHPNKKRYQGGSYIVPLYVNREAGDLMPNVMEKFAFVGPKATLNAAKDWAVGNPHYGFGSLPSLTNGQFWNAGTEWVTLFGADVSGFHSAIDVNEFTYLLSPSAKKWTRTTLGDDFYLDPIRVTSAQLDAGQWVDILFDKWYEYDVRTSGLIDEFPNPDFVARPKTAPLNINSYGPVVWGGQHFAWNVNWMMDTHTYLGETKNVPQGYDISWNTENPFVEAYKKYWKFNDPRSAMVLGASMSRSSRLGGGLMDRFSSGIFTDQATLFHLTVPYSSTLPTDNESFYHGGLSYPLANSSSATTGITIAHASANQNVGIDAQIAQSSNHAFSIALTPIGDDFQPNAYPIRMPRFDSNTQNGLSGYAGNDGYQALLYRQAHSVQGMYSNDGFNGMDSFWDLGRYGRTLSNSLETYPSARRFKVGNWLDSLLDRAGIPAQSGSMLPPGARVYLEVTSPTRLLTLSPAPVIGLHTGTWVSSVKCSFEVETADGTAWTLDVNKLGDD